MKKKTVSIMVAAAMAAALFAGCGSSGSDTSDTGSAAAESSTTESETATNTNIAEIPEVPDLDGMTSNEWLLSQSDKLCLSGVVSTSVESRADVYKGLDQVDYDDDEVNIVFLASSQGTKFFTTMTEAIQEKCDEYGYNLTVYDANFDLTTQQEQFENVLSTDVDFIFCNATDIDALADMFRQSAEQGVPVIVTGPTSAQDDYNVLTTILSGSWSSGFEDGMYAAEYCWGQYDEALKVGVVITQLGDADSESRPNGFIAGYLYKYAELAGEPYDSKWDAAVIAYNTWIELRDSGSAEIEGILDLEGYVTTDNIATSEAQPACAELLTTYPDIDLAFVETDSYGLAMVTECYQEGLQPGEDLLIVYGADGTSELCQAVKDGDVLCIATNLPYTNATGIDLIHDILEEGYDANDLPANSYTPTYAVTAENVDEVWDGEAAYASMLEEWELQTTEEYNAANAE